MKLQTNPLVQEKSLHSIISDELARQIRTGELPRGGQLLGERELCKHFDASRVTLRKALGKLRDLGLIASDSSRGWFVVAPPVGEPNALVSFSEMALSRGLEVSSIVIRSLIRTASIDEAEVLAIAPGSEIFELERVRRLDDVPVGIERTRIPQKLAPQLSQVDFARASLYVELEKAGLRPALSEYAIQAVSASASDAEHLGVAPDTALLMVNAVTRLRDGRPVELSRSLFLGDRYRFNTTLFRLPRSGAR